MSIKAIFVFCLFALFNISHAVEKGEVQYRCGIAVGFPPYQYVDDKGKPAGIDYEIASMVFKKAGLKVTFVQDEWEFLLSSIIHRSENIDMLCGAEISPERTGLLEFTEPYYKRHIVLFTLKNSPIKNLNDLNGKIIAGDKHSFLELNLGPKKDEIRIMKTPSKEDSFKKLKDGSVIAAIAPREVGLFLANKLKLEVEIIEAKDPGSPVAFAVTKNNKDLLKKVNDAMKTLIKEGEVQKVLIKHRGY